MLPLKVDKAWYDGYWYTDHPHPRRRSFSGSLARFAVLVTAIVVGGTVLSHFRPSQEASESRPLLSQWSDAHRIH